MNTTKITILSGFDRKNSLNPSVGVEATL